MITTALTYRLVVALVAIGVALSLARWRRRSREEWRAYDDAHGDDPVFRDSRAAARARRHRR